MKRNEKIKKITIISIFAALSVVLYFIKFPLPIFPGFLKIQFSNLPIIIAGFSFGPQVAIIILLIKTIVGLIVYYGESFGIGELADLMIGIAVVLTTSLIYQKHKTKKRGLIALLFGCLAWVVSAVVVNYVILVPIYITFYFDSSIDAFVGACKVIPGINTSNYKLYYILLATIPFNIMLSLSVSAITYLVYKRISKIIK